jgi:hypothetical protein
VISIKYTDHGIKRRDYRCISLYNPLSAYKALLAPLKDIIRLINRRQGGKSPNQVKDKQRYTLAIYCFLLLTLLSSFLILVPP